MHELLIVDSDLGAIEPENVIVPFVFSIQWLDLDNAPKRPHRWEEAPPYSPPPGRR